jgi:hypothetical protein
LAGAGARSGVIEGCLKVLGWKMLRTGVVSANYNCVFEWNLPTAGSDLDAVLRGASMFRLLRSAPEEGTPIEFRHPLFRDYFAAERTAAILDGGSDLHEATEGQYAVPDWREALLMTAGLRGPKAGEMVSWLITKDCPDLAFDCWADSEARNDRSVTTTLAAALRALVTPSNIEFADTLITQLGELRDPKAVPLIVQFMEKVGSWARFEAIPGLERIRSDEALAALVQAIDGEDEDTTRDAREALLRIGADAIPALLRSSGSAAETIRGQLAPRAVDKLTTALEDPDAKIRARAVLALGMSVHADAAGAIIRLLQDDAAGVRTEAARALGRLGNPVATPALVVTLHDENPAVRFEAASPLWEHDWAGSAAKASLMEIYESMGKYASWKIKVLTCLMTRPDDEIAAMIFEACRDGNEEVRRGAFALLDRVPRNIDDLLKEGLRDSSPTIHIYAHRSIIERHAEGALHWVTEAFEEHPTGRRSLLGLIDRTHGEAGTKYLMQVLDSGLDEAVRAAAAKKLSDREDPGVSASLERAFRKADPTKEPVLVSELLLGVQHSEDPAVGARIKSIAEDETAAEKLRERAQWVRASRKARADA